MKIFIFETLDFSRHPRAPLGLLDLKLRVKVKIKVNLTNYDKVHNPIVLGFFFVVVVVNVVVLVFIVL